MHAERGDHGATAADAALAMPLRLGLARFRAFVWRFHTLRLAERIFAPLSGPAIAHRRFCGYRLHLDVSRSSAQRLLLLEGERFVGERRLVRSLLAPGMRVADVGANIGYYLLLIESAVGPSGHVTCFEPDPQNLRELRRNVQANDLANVEVVAAAVGAGDGIVALRSGINALVVEDGAGDHQVPLLRLDSALSGVVDFLKIDVEGYEGHVLAGAQRILAEQRPALWLEIHPDLLPAPHTVDEIWRVLAAHYPAPELFETSPEAGPWAKVSARYLGRGVRRVPDPAGLLAACRDRRRAQPFWAICRPAKRHPP
ncbi:MAG TPA: FkbM family methyltransferase [Thermoanaerobaculia bacterium]|nr:FkbM family methyltransferase [Thermoanaerobaculia bacterium]